MKLWYYRQSFYLIIYNILNIECFRPIRRKTDMRLSAYLHFLYARILDR